MNFKVVVFLCLLLVGVQLAAGARRVASESSSQDLHTQNTPPRCARGASQLILAEESRLEERLRVCAWRHIFLQGTEILTDTAYFVFGLYNHGATLVSDLKQCVQETCWFEKLVCALDKSPSALVAMGELITGAISYALQLKELLPDVISEVKECRDSTLTEHQRFLDTVLHSARMC